MDNIISYNYYDEYTSGASGAYGHRWEHINGVETSLEYRFVETLHQKLGRTCPYCGGKMSTINLTSVYSKKPSHSHNNYVFDEGSCNAFQCPHCFFWLAEQYMDTGEFRITDVALSIQQSFPINSKFLPIERLNEIILKNPKTIYSLHHSVFEKFIQELIKVEFGHAEVIHIGKPADGGIDLILVISENEKLLIQCKRRMKDGMVEGVEVVRSLLGSLLLHGELKGVIVSNADSFSYHAQAAIKNPFVKQQGYKIELYDKGKLFELIGKSPIINPWDTFFTRMSHNRGLDDPTAYFPYIDQW